MVPEGMVRFRAENVVAQGAAVPVCDPEGIIEEGGEISVAALWKEKCQREWDVETWTWVLPTLSRSI
jgi:hypothetical protein